jgi:hypothetical protein
VGEVIHERAQLPRERMIITSYRRRKLLERLNGRQMGGQSTPFLATLPRLQNAFAAVDCRAGKFSSTELIDGCHAGGERACGGIYNNRTAGRDRYRVLKNLVGRQSCCIRAIADDRVS